MDRSRTLDPLTPNMIGGLIDLVAGPAMPETASHRDCERFVNPNGRLIRAETLKALSKRGLARQLLAPSRFLLTAAGRRLANQLAAAQRAA